MIRRYECDAQTSHGQMQFRPRAASACTASWETGRVARIQAKEIANPASEPDSGVFFELNIRNRHNAGE